MRDNRETGKRETLQKSAWGLGTVRPLGVDLVDLALSSTTCPLINGKRSQRQIADDWCALAGARCQDDDDSWRRR